MTKRVRYMRNDISDRNSGAVDVTGDWPVLKPHPWAEGGVDGAPELWQGFVYAAPGSRDAVIEGRGAITLVERFDIEAYSDFSAK